MTHAELRPASAIFRKSLCGISQCVDDSTDRLVPQFVKNTPAAALMRGLLLAVLVAASVLTGCGQLESDCAWAAERVAGFEACKADTRCVYTLRDFRIHKAYERELAQCRGPE